MPLPTLRKACNAPAQISGAVNSRAPCKLYTAEVPLFFFYITLSIPTRCSFKQHRSYTSSSQALLRFASLSGRILMLTFLCWFIKLFFYHLIFFIFPLIVPAGLYYFRKARFFSSLGGRLYKGNRMLPIEEGLLLLPLKSFVSWLRA